MIFLKFGQRVAETFLIDCAGFLGPGVWRFRPGLRPTRRLQGR